MVQNHLKYLVTKSGYLNKDNVERGKIDKNSLIFLVLLEREGGVGGGSFIQKYRSQ